MSFSAPRSGQESFSASQICNSTTSSVAAVICIDPFIAIDPTFPSFSGTLGVAFLQEDVEGGERLLPAQDYFTYLNVYMR